MKSWAEMTKKNLPDATTTGTSTTGAASPTATSPGSSLPQKPSSTAPTNNKENTSPSTATSNPQQVNGISSQKSNKSAAEVVAANGAQIKQGSAAKPQNQPQQQQRSNQPVNVQAPIPKRLAHPAVHGPPRTMSAPPRTSEQKQSQMMSKGQKLVEQQQPQQPKEQVQKVVEQPSQPKQSETTAATTALKASTSTANADSAKPISAQQPNQVPSAKTSNSKQTSESHPQTSSANVAHTTTSNLQGQQQHGSHHQHGASQQQQPHQMQQAYGYQQQQQRMPYMPYQPNFYMDPSLMGVPFNNQYRMPYQAQPMYPGYYTATAGTYAPQTSTYAANTTFQTSTNVQAPVTMSSSGSYNYNPQMAQTTMPYGGYQQQAFSPTTAAPSVPTAGAPTQVATTPSARKPKIIIKDPSTMKEIKLAPTTEIAEKKQEERKESKEVKDVKTETKEQVKESSVAVAAAAPKTPAKVVQEKEEQKKPITPASSVQASPAATTVPVTTSTPAPAAVKAVVETTHLPKPTTPTTTPAATPAATAAPVAAPSTPKRVAVQIRDPTTGQLVTLGGSKKPQTPPPAPAPAAVVEPKVEEEEKPEKKEEKVEEKPKAIKDSPVKPPVEAKVEKKVEEVKKEPKKEVVVEKEEVPEQKEEPSAEEAAKEEQTEDSAKDLEEGEIPESEEARAKADLKEKILSMSHDQLLPEFKSTILTQLNYTTTRPHPTIEKGIIRYPLEFLRLFRLHCTDKPAGLSPDAPVGAEGVQSPRPDSGSGRGRTSRSSSQSSAQMMRQSSSGSLTGSMNAGQGGNRAQMSSQERFNLAISQKQMGGVTGVMSGMMGGKGSMGSRSMSAGTGAQSGYVNFLNQYMKTPSSRQGQLPPRAAAGGASGRKGGRQRGQQPVDNINPATGEPFEPLKISENAWRPGQGIKTESEEDRKRLEILKKCKGILNKLTLEKFQSLSDQIIDIGIVDEEILKLVIQCIFDKATDEPHFGAMYANLCAKMSAELPQKQPWLVDESNSRNNLFRRYLLSQCQKEYESGSKWTERKTYDKKVEDMTPEEKDQVAEDELARQKLKRRALGNIRFIGELFKLHIIGRKIMYQCVTQLLQNIDDPEEEEVESLSKLMMTIGPELDAEEAKGYMDAYFDRIEKLSRNEKLPSRLRFALLDVLDARKDKWQGRFMKKEGPKTIAQIRADAERAQRAAEEATRQMSRSGSGRGGPRDGRDYGSGSGRSSNTVDKKVGDMSKYGQFSLQKHADISNIKLGPANNVFSGGSKGWAKSSSSTGKSSENGKKQTSGTTSPTGSSMNDRTPSQSSIGGMFNALMSEEESHHDHSHDEKVASTDALTEETKSEPEQQKLTSAQADKKIQNMRDEFFSLLDVANAIETMKELGTDEYNTKVILELINGAVERKQSDAKATSDLIDTLLGEDLVTKKDVCDALATVFGTIEDTAIDVPEIYKHVSLVIAPLLTRDDEKQFTLGDVFELSEPVRSSPSRIPPVGQLLGELFRAVKGSFDNDQTALEEWYQNQTQGGSPSVNEFWPESTTNKDEVISRWMNKYDLLFLDPLMALVRELKPRLDNDKTEQIMTWITEHFSEAITSQPEFIRTITSSLLRYLTSRTVLANGPDSPVELTPEMFNKLKELYEQKAPLQSTFVQGKDEETSRQLQLEVLFATQNYCAEIKFPQGFMEALWRLLYAADFIDEEIFMAWYSDTTREQESKKEAVKQVGKWYKWLESAQ